MDKDKAKNLRITVALVFLLALAVYEACLSGVFFFPPVTDMFDGLVTRLLGSAAVLAIVGGLGINLFNKLTRKAVIAVLPCFVAVICNPPLEGLIFGDAELSYVGAELVWYVALLAAECLAVGLFEELLFRGALFTVILEKRRNNSKEVFLAAIFSSAVFALVHLVNLFVSSPLAVFMQVGYSFLIGGLCSFVFLKTGNVLASALLHAVFNFGGTLVEVLGEGGWGGLPTLLITLVVGIAAGIYVIRSYLKISIEETDKLYK